MNPTNLFGMWQQRQLLAQNSYKRIIQLGMFPELGKIGILRKKTCEYYDTKFVEVPPGNVLQLVTDWEPSTPSQLVQVQ